MCPHDPQVRHLIRKYPTYLNRSPTNKLATVMEERKDLNDRSTPQTKAGLGSSVRRRYSKQDELSGITKPDEIGLLVI